MSDSSRQTRKQSQAIWSGCFDSWENCVQKASERNAGLAEATNFESTRWTNKLLDMYEQAMQGAYPRATTLPAVAALIDAEVIVDFGGGSGWTYQLLDPKVREKLRSYVVIEQAGVVDAMKDYVQMSKDIQFTHLSALTHAHVEPVDILYANSALQYLLSDSEISFFLDLLDPKIVLLDDLQVSSGVEFFSLQNYYGTHIPCRFFSVPALISLMFTRNYEFVGQWPYSKSY